MRDSSELLGLGGRGAQKSFAQTPAVHTGRSVFNRSFGVKDTFDFDYLTPVYVDEILPGDTVNLNAKFFARLATQEVPVMDNMYLDWFWFFVPNRLVWTNWVKFCGEQDNPGDTIDYSIPVITINDTNGFQVGELADKFGIPTDVDDISVNALPFRCYNLIYNTWFRDQNLINSVTVNVDNGPDAATDYALLKRAKKHDYFTSCLPWPQKGTAVTLDLGTSAPVSFDGANNEEVLIYSTVGSNERRMDIVGTHVALDTSSGGTNALYADLSSATAATLNSLRLAFMTQSLLELDARGGTRYVEIIKAHFNVVSPDFRHQRPEFLSGGSTRINQHPVAQTSEDGVSDLASLSAYATASNIGNNIGFSKSFTEHGYVIGMVQARADITYQHGLHKMWTRSTRYDFFWPKLQELGEQAVLNQEIYAQGSGVGVDTNVFGYQERYAEYKYKPSEIHGQFRSTYTSSLEVWHLAEEFGSLPTLNQTFIESTTPIERSLKTAASYPHLILDAYFDLKHARPMMTYGVPATLGRF